ncbi:MAG: acyl carrier protein [Actinobacteria bacterium]|nr:acyl carrier protein [Actinomycetota bacterium]
MSTTDELRTQVLEALGAIAPDADLATLSDDASLRDELDLDSMDMQGLVVGLYEATGIDVPERDYGKLDTVADTVAYLAAHRPGGQ